MKADLSLYPRIFENTKKMLRDDVEDIPEMEKSNDVDLIEDICSSLLENYYDAALLSYLLDGSITSFHDNLYRAARSHLYIIEKQKGINEINWSFIRASNIRSIQCALAIGDMSLARRISKSQTKKLIRPYDAYDYYSYCMTLRSIIEEAPEEALSFFEDFERAREGKREGAAMMLQALLEKESDTFNEAIHVFIDEWQKIARKDDFKDLAGGIRPGEETICIQALGFLKLAESLGIKCDRDYPLVPKNIRELNDFKPPTDGYPTL